MKHLRLLVALLTLLTGGGNLAAQTWNASELTDGGKYVFLNVGSGRYLGPGNSWGTQASLIECSHYNTIHKLADGAYQIESQVSNGGTAYYFNGSFLDNNSPVSVTIQDNGEGIFTMSTNDSYYGYDGSTTVLANNLTDPTNTNAQWKIMAYDDVYANASEENLVDLTYMILDSNFDRNNRNGGGENNDLGNKWTMVASNQNLCGGTDANKCAESWRSTFTLSQAISVPNGYYKLRAQAALTEYTVTSADFPVVYATSGANTVTTPFNTMQDGEASMNTMSDKFTSGKYWTNYTDVITVSNKSLTVGVKGTRTDTWCIWDNFQLIYMGPIDLTEFANQLAAAVTAAEAVEGTVPAAAYEQISAVVTENNKEYSTEEDYSAAIEAINNAVATYATTAIINDYSRYKNIRTAVLAINESINVSQADEDVEKATTTEGIDAAILTLRNALTDYLPTATLTEGQTIDLTDALIDNAAPGISGSLDYWTNSVTPGLQYQLYEYYQKSGATTKQTIASTLPAGNYKLTAVAFTRTNYEAKLSAGEASTNIATVSPNEVNDRQGGDTWIAAGNGNTDLLFTLAEATPNLEIGLTADNANGDHWMCWRSFRLVYGNVFPAYTLVTGKMNTAVETAQMDAEAAFTANKTVDTYNTLTAAIAAAEASVAAYAIAAKALTDANALKEAHNFASEAATTAFANAIADIQTKYDNGTLTDEEATAGGNLGTIATAWHAGNNTPVAVYLRDGFALASEFAGDPALHVNTWSTEGDTDGSNFSVPFYESWTADANSLPESTLTGSLTGLDNGLYKVSALVRVSAKTGVNATDATGITMDVNNGTAVDVTEGEVIGTTQRSIATYEAEGLVKQGQLTLNFNIAADANISWLAFKNVKYTKVRDLTPEEAFVAATAEDYAALNAAIEGKVLGFEAGEYAPYNNVEGVATIAAAKAIDQTAENAQEDVQAATAAITNATWTANTTEVNAVYDGSFEADYSGQSGNINPTGWQRVKGAAADGYNVRLMNGTNAGLAATTSGKALFTKQSAYYGYADGYTMPLKANTIYKITFIYGGWGDCKKDGYVSMAAPDGSAVTLSATDLPVDATNADADVNAWKQYKATFTTGEAGDYVLGMRKKNYDTSGQSQYVYGDIVLVKATADDFKDQLKAELDKANSIDTEANVGEGAFQIPATAATALTSEITEAQSVYDNAAATVIDVQTAITNLQSAEETYNNAELNAPAEGQLFNVILTYSGWTYDNKAITFIANGRSDQGNYNIQYKEEANQNLAQAFTFTKVEGNNYKLSQIDADGNVRYITDGKTGYNSGDGSGIRTTTEADKAAAFKIIATNTDGVYNIWNNVKGNYIGSQDAGVYTVNSHIDFKLVETTKPSITINTTAAGWGTTILPFAVNEIPEGVKVYSCLEDKGASLELTEVEALEANKPYIIEGAWNATLTGDAQGTALSYEDGQLVGTYVRIAAPNGCYILQKHDDKVGFFVVDTEKAQPNVPANRAYMKASTSGAKAFYLGEETNGINAIEALVSGNAEIFNINGVKQNSLQKGINIIKTEDGKTHKIMVK